MARMAVEDAETRIQARYKLAGIYNSPHNLAGFYNSPSDAGSIATRINYSGTVLCICFTICVKQFGWCCDACVLSSVANTWQCFGPFIYEFRWPWWRSIGGSQQIFAWGIRTRRPATSVECICKSWARRITIIIIIIRSANKIKACVYRKHTMLQITVFSLQSANAVICKLVSTQTLVLFALYIRPRRRWWIMHWSLVRWWWIMHWSQVRQSPH